MSKAGKFEERHVFLLLAIAFFLAAGCAGVSAPPRQPLVIRAAPAISLLSAASPAPGLSALYFHEFFRHIDRMPTGGKALEQGLPGPPILFLGHHFNKDNVFDSGRNQGVGLLMNGLIRLDRPGTYRFKALSNDGIRVRISGLTIVDDPGVHSDRYSGQTEVDVLTAGWYPIQVQYFQRKGTATLALYWQPPGQKAFEIIPPKAFAHRMTDS